MDLAITACLLAFCAAIIFRVSKRYSLRHPSFARLIVVLTLSIGIWLSWSSSYSLRWAEWFPHGSVLLLANASVILVLATAGFAVGIPKLSERRKSLMTWALSLTAIATIGSVLIRPLAHPLTLATRSQWQDGVCLQSHEASCAPAAAATLLDMHGIPTDERRMAVHCLTSSQGTFTLAAFRGLHMGSKDQGLATRALVCTPSDYPVERMDQQLPMLAMVNFEDQLSFANIVRGRGGDQHAVVVIKRLDDGHWLVADPAVGKIRWTDEYFRSVWIGEGIYLVSQ